MSHISRSASAGGWRLSVPAVNAEPVMFENPESGGRQEDTDEMGWSALAGGVIGASIPALLALETLAGEPRWPGPARTGEDPAARQ
jgi:hypothetical protein